MVEVSFWPILVAGVSAVLLGYIWYHPKVFGTYWMRASGITPEQAEKAKKRMPLMAFIALLAAMLVAWVMNYVGIALGIYDWAGAIFDLALWIWLGFTAPILLGSVLWEQKPIKLYLVNALYWLVALIVMSLILLYGSVLTYGTGSVDQTDTTSVDSGISAE